MTDIIQADQVTLSSDTPALIQKINDKLRGATWDPATPIRIFTGTTAVEIQTNPHWRAGSEATELNRAKAALQPIADLYEQAGWEVNVAAVLLGPHPTLRRNEHVIETSLLFRLSTEAIKRIVAQHASLPQPDSD